MTASSAESGFHLNQLHRIETGEPISVQILLKLCAAFYLTIAKLVQDLGEGKRSIIAELMAD